MDSVESRTMLPARPGGGGEGRPKSLGDGVLFEHDEQQENQDGHHGTDERPE